MADRSSLNLFVTLIVCVTILQAEQSSASAQCEVSECLGQPTNERCIECISRFGHQECCPEIRNITPFPLPVYDQSSGGSFRKISKVWIIVIVAGVLISCALTAGVVYVCRKKYPRGRKRKLQRRRQRGRDGQQVTRILFEGNVTSANDHRSETARHMTHMNVQRAASMETSRFYEVNEVRNDLAVDITTENNDYMQLLWQSHSDASDITSMLPATRVVNDHPHRGGGFSPQTNRFTSSIRHQSNVFPNNSIQRNSCSAVRPGEETPPRDRFIFGDICLPPKTTQHVDDGSSLVDELFGPLYVKTENTVCCRTAVTRNEHTDLQRATATIGLSPRYSHNTDDTQSLRKHRSDVPLVEGRYSQNTDNTQSLSKHRSDVPLVEARYSQNTDDTQSLSKHHSDVPLVKANDTVPRNTAGSSNIQTNRCNILLAITGSDDSDDDEDDEEEYVPCDPVPKACTHKPGGMKTVDDPFPYITVDELIQTQKTQNNYKQITDF